MGDKLWLGSGSVCVGWAVSSETWERSIFAELWKESVWALKERGKVTVVV